MLTNVAGSVDIVDFSDPASPTQLQRVEVNECGTPNSAAIHPRHDFFLVVCAGVAGQQGTVAAYRLSYRELT